MGPTSASGDDQVERVIVPSVHQPISDAQVSYLFTLVEPLRQCDDYGRSFYVTTRQIVRGLVA